MNLVPLLDYCRPKQWPTLSAKGLPTHGYPVYGANGIIGYHKSYTHDKPVLLVGCRGSCGSLHITSGKIYANGNAMAMDQLSNDIDLKFLYFYLRHRGLRDAITGTSQPQITQTSLRKVTIPLMQMDEQRRIADILDQADALRRKQQEAHRLANDYLASVFNDMFGAPDTNPHGFPFGTIRDYVTSANYGTAKKSESTGAYPVLRMGNVTNSGGWDFSDLKYTDLNEREVDKFTVKAGDLLFNRTNSKDLVGKTAVFREARPMAYAGYLVRVRFTKDAEAEYIAGYLNSPHGKATLRHMCKNIVGMANINAQEMQNIQILKPPVALQRKYAALVREVIQVKAKQAGAIDHADAVCKSLSNELFG